MRTMHIEHIQYVETLTQQFSLVGHILYIHMYKVNVASLLIFFNRF